MPARGPLRPDPKMPQPPVLFETVGQLRKYILNRPKKLNALDTSMLNLLRPYVEVSRFSRSGSLVWCSLYVRTGVGHSYPRSLLVKVLAVPFAQGVMSPVRTI